MGGSRVSRDEIKRMEYLRSHGMTNAQVANAMGVAYYTVLRHIGLQSGKVAEIVDAPPPPKPPPYTVKFTAKEIRFDRSGALVTISQGGDVSVEIGKDLLVFTADEFKDFVGDMRLALEI